MTNLPEIKVLLDSEPSHLRCLVEQTKLPADEDGMEIHYENPDINKTEVPGVSQVIIPCPVEGCVAEFEVYAGADGEGLASIITEESFRAAKFVCRNQGSVQYGKRG